MTVWTLKNDIYLKSSSVNKLVKAGTDVTVFPQNTDVVLITDIKFRLPWKTAHHYFDEVIEITDELICNGLMDDCVTVLGDPIEPDGKDPQGFPSILIAIGIV